MAKPLNIYVYGMWPNYETKFQQDWCRVINEWIFWDRMDVVKRPTNIQDHTCICYLMDMLHIRTHFLISACYHRGVFMMGRVYPIVYPTRHIWLFHSYNTKHSVTSKILKFLCDLWCVYQCTLHVYGCLMKASF